MGFVGTEVEATTKVSFSPLLGLQVWLHGRAPDNEWAQAIAARVTDADPEGLYIHWVGLHDRQAGSVVIRNASYRKRPLYRAFADQGMERIGLALDPDLYDVVRINGPAITDENEQVALEQVKGSLLQLTDTDASPDPLIARARRMQRMLQICERLYPGKLAPQEPAQKESISERPLANEDVRTAQEAVAAAPEKPWWED
jgi:hypothetical protein